MDKTKKESMENLKEVFTSMDNSISRLVLAEDGEQALIGLVTKDPIAFAAMLSIQMKENRGLAEIITMAYDAYKFPHTERETESSDYIDQIDSLYRTMPRDAVAFSIVSHGGHTVAHLNGSVIKVSAKLCEFQEHNPKAIKILNIAVEGFKMAEKTGFLDELKTKGKDAGNVN
ncbi:hypothetical protein [Sphingobacterium siyangense]|uniref:Uncharacterized protein n=1 Tax=Sphingobacterium siyangense TaxID=459529 RepID=A0A562MQD3_9SPHI|nr:hypothetical protein [Sphingobacterium siyangense]TWI22167.1 hypothetical protein IQ31_01572 [Sphingobacterium siyangense]